MINENGYSWPESILSLGIVMVIFGTLFPFYSHMSARLEMKRLEMHAAETVYHAAILHKSYGLSEGVNRIEEVTYIWTVNADSICVMYKSIETEVIKCINF
ncbi:hypothetical protein QTL97_10365 [Sporosarcina thermotolerans]|uniref:Type II secretion system protein n=1 Tax=Sporosarcina thermotolerans TaxID=633404 RepID=A0AAW9A9P2_9BACL|nr:hypothetical protein [Sporosarcina thermotolerans]MDW0117338.1 hypothetical protein [Sporosarcina thermotolerans]WHT47488.1 hypothetical protein QNH10_15105 [Sporosarcina thermotolerans]